MRCAIVLTLLLDLAVAAFGNECSPGYKHRANLTGLMCTDATKTAANCNSECCEADKNTCGGLDATETIKCPSDKYKGMDAAWAKTAATYKTRLAKCCTTKATCGGAGYTPPAGYKSTGKNKYAKCEGGPKTCALSSLCVEADTTKCGGNADGLTESKARTKCAGTGGAAFKFLKNGKYDDAWKKLKLATTFDADCCQAVKCSDTTLYKCEAGLTAAGAVAKQAWALTTAAVKALSTLPCDGQPDGGAMTKDNKMADCAKPCCVPLKDTCGGATMKGPNKGVNPIDCADVSKYTPTTGDTNLNEWRTRAGATEGNAAAIKAACCLPKPKCSSHSCSAGRKKKTSPPTDCSRLGTCETECCEDDLQKCGKMSGIECPYGFFDESSAWISTGTGKTSKAIKDTWMNKAGNRTTKNVNCCTPREACKVPPVGTTTPAAVATTTPAAPALKFSEHKAAVGVSADRSWGANMVCLGVGALIGMGVLMIVQVLRSKSQATQADDEDADMLLGTSE